MMDCAITRINHSNTDIDALAKPHQLCPPCRRFCNSSVLLQNIPRNHAIRRQELNEGKELSTTPRRSESFDIHEYSSFRTCATEALCHLCSIAWAELAAEYGSNNIEKIRARSTSSQDEKDRTMITGTVSSGGEDGQGHGLLTFEYGIEKCKTGITLLSGFGKIVILPGQYIMSAHILSM